MAQRSKPQPTTPIESRLFDVKSAAAYLSSTVWFVRTLAWERRIAFLRCGSRILFDKRDLDNFIENNKVAVGR